MASQSLRCCKKFSTLSSHKFSLQSLNACGNSRSKYCWIISHSNHTHMVSHLYERECLESRLATDSVEMAPHNVHTHLVCLQLICIFILDINLKSVWMISHNVHTLSGFSPLLEWQTPPRCISFACLIEFQWIHKSHISQGSRRSVTSVKPRVVFWLP